MAPPPAKGVNQKQETGRAKKAEVDAKKQADLQKQQEAAEAASWREGANTKRSGKEEAMAHQADEASRKRKEKQALLEAEEAALAAGGGGGAVKKVAGGAAAKQSKKNVKKDDLSLLEDALVSAADKRARQKKLELEARKRQDEEALRRKEEQAAAIAASQDPLLANTEQMLGGALDDNELDVGRQANVSRMAADGASGINAALDTLSLTGSSAPLGANGQPLKSAKALYNDFEARMLPVVKDEHPGLRLTQYKEKIWNLWKKSPDNPANQLLSS